MTRLPLALALAVAGCATHAEDSTVPPDGVDTANTGTTADTSDTADTSALPPECEHLAPLPVEAGYLSGFTGAEDFAFDAEGRLVSIDPYGNLVAITQDGTQQVILPQATAYGAGTHFLPDGEIVFCDVEAGSLVRVDPNTGESTVVLGGLEYPNGLDVGTDGFVYVSEQNAGRVRRVDPVTGEYAIILTGLYQPNGVTFAPGFDRIFVGSFGAGVVWAADRNPDETWSEPRIYGTTPEAPGVPPDWCDSHAVGDACPLEGGYSLGACADDGTGDLTCAENLAFDACVDKAEDESCTSELLGTTIDQTCHSRRGSLWCPRTPTEAEASCSGKSQGDRCSVGSGRGQCSTTFEGVLACWDYNAYYTEMVDSCADKALDDECAIVDTHYPTVGRCQDGSAYGYTENLCLPVGSASQRGGLDAINTDACGNLYVSEYTMGKVWRFTAEGVEADEAATLSSMWIPNMHWGNGRGGWDEKTLYVMDRVGPGIFTLELGVGSHGDAYVPPE